MKADGSGVFSVLPESFFSPLAGSNRKHYAALLTLYYHLFQESTRGIERELVLREFMGYLALNHGSILEEVEDECETQAQADSRARSVAIQNTLFEKDGERETANRFLRRLISSGWLSEETLSDWTRVINITAWGKPFFEALVQIEEGRKTEYESHVVNVYSSLCGETVYENGHFMVLKAREEARSLIDSLKVLSQSIKLYYDAINAEAIKTSAAAALHEHYDLYAGDVLDKAYKRLKTSDNVSRYRTRIFKQISTLLADEAWLEASASKYVRILQTSNEDCREKLIKMLCDIRDDLRSVDPLEDEIDRRNAAYSRASVEIIKSFIEPDSTIAGKIGSIIKVIYSGDEKLNKNLAHNLFRVKFTGQASFVLRRVRSEDEFDAQAVKARGAEETQAVREAEEALLLRLRKQISMRKISQWLCGAGGDKKILSAADLIHDEKTFLSFIYALLYGDSRKNFEYLIEDTQRRVQVNCYDVPDVRFRKKDVP